MRLSPRRWLQPLAGISITLVFAWLLMDAVDLAELGSALGRLTLPALTLALLSLALGYSLRILRWWWMLRALDPNIAPSACFWPFVVSISINNLVPFRAGDMMRVFGFRRQLGAPTMRVLGTLLIERLLDLMVLLGLFFLFMQGVVNDRLPQSFVTIASLLAGAGALSVLLLLLFAGKLRHLINRLACHPFVRERGLSEAIDRHAAHLIGTLEVLRTPLMTIQLALLSIGVWLFEAGVFASIAFSLDAGVPLSGAGFAMTTGTLATLLPSSPGYVGTFDYFTLLGLEAYGADASVAGAVAVGVHLVLWLPLTALGLIYFLLPGAQLLRAKLSETLTKGD